MIDYQNILNRLDCVRPVSLGRWRARCPAHTDREPSLQITEGRDGGISCHCIHSQAPADRLLAAKLLGGD